uniref:Uncharacterized protein n=1 Tax=Parascaris equorum TaxID=6256 RepID=A0A914RCV5_PAREQ
MWCLQDLFTFEADLDPFSAENGQRFALMDDVRRSIDMPQRTDGSS